MPVDLLDSWSSDAGDDEDAGGGRLDLLAGLSDNSGGGELQAALSPAVVPAGEPEAAAQLRLQVAVPPAVVVGPAGAQGARPQRRFGKGAHGSVLERRLLTSHAREAKARKAKERIRASHAEGIVQVCSTLKRRHRSYCLKVLVRRKKATGMVCLVRRSIAKHAKHGPHSTMVSSADILEIGFAYRKAGAHIGAIFQLDTKWVRILRRFVAAAYLHYQNLALGQLVEAARARPPLFTMARIAYDETGEKLTLPLQGSSVWQVMVARIELIVGWRGEQGNQVVKFSAILPNMLVVSPNAANIYHSLHFHSQLAPVHAALRLLYSSSSWAIEVHETDGAYACDRLMAHLLSTRSASSLLDCHFRCRLHGTQLIEASILAVLPGKLLSRLYSLTLFVRTSGYFARMGMEVPRLIDHALLVRQIAAHGEPPVEAREFAHEVADFMASHHKRFERISDYTNRQDEVDRDSESDCDEHDWESLRDNPRLALAIHNVGLRQYVQSLLDLLSACNGKWWEQDVVHFCRGPDCCPPSGPEDQRSARARTAMRIVVAVKRTVFRSVLRAKLGIRVPLKSEIREMPP